MSILLYSTRIQGNVLSKKESHEKNYELFKESHFYWAFVDLKHSSNYRIVYGPLDGYVRSESFFSLVSEVIAPCEDVRKIKEIGDEVFLCSSSFRSLFECIVMIWFIADKLSSALGSEKYPFSIRAAIGSGPAKRLDRGSDDFVGSPIDQLSRIMSLRDEDNDIRIHESVYNDNIDIMDEYKSFLSVGNTKLLTLDKAKSIGTNIFYRNLELSTPELELFSNHFTPWR